MFVSLLINIVNDFFVNSNWFMFERIIVIILNLVLISLVIYLSNYHLKSNYLFEKIMFTLFFTLIIIFYNVLSSSNDIAIPIITVMLVVMVFYSFPTYLFLFGVSYLIRKNIKYD